MITIDDDLQARIDAIRRDKAQAICGPISADVIEANLKSLEGLNTVLERPIPRSTHGRIAVRLQYVFNILFGGARLLNRMPVEDSFCLRLELSKTGNGQRIILEDLTEENREESFKSHATRLGNVGEGGVVVVFVDIAHDEAPEGRASETYTESAPLSIPIT